jgi:hypothetical protein
MLTLHRPMEVQCRLVTPRDPSMPTSSLFFWYRAMKAIGRPVCDFHDGEHLQTMLDNQCRQRPSADVWLHSYQGQTRRNMSGMSQHSTVDVADIDGPASWCYFAYYTSSDWSQSKASLRYGIRFWVLLLSRWHGYGTDSKCWQEILTALYCT